MKEIKDRNLFGLILKGLDGEDKKVKIIELDNSEYEGVVIGFTREYILNNEVIPAAFRLHCGNVSCRIKIDEIQQLFIEK